MVYPIARATLFPLVCLIVKSIEGLERIPKNRACVFAANHLGLLDPLIVGALLIRATKRPVRFLVDPGHRYWRFVGRFTSWWTRAIPVDHADHDRMFETIRRFVTQGDSIGIFPEGEITHKPHLLRPKIGVIKIARDTSVPIVPIGLQRTNLSLIKAVVSRLRGPEGITVRIGDPITIPRETPTESFQALADSLMRTVARLSSLPFPY